MKKTLALLLALVMCLAMLTACGSTDNNTTTPDTDANTDTQQPEDTTKPEDPQQITFTTVKEGVLTMSTNAAFPPYEMTTDDGGFEGIDVEIAQAIADKLGLELEILDMDFDAALMAVQEGKSDIVLAGVTVDEDRLLVMDFTDSYANGVQSIIVPEGSDITTNDLSGKTIGTQRGTTGWQYCSDDYGDDAVVAYDDGITAVQALLNGQVDCVVIDNAPATSFVAANQGLKILDTEYANEDYAIGLQKGNTALLEAINGALAELKADGTIQTIIDKYIPAE
ncbi:MAG: amino acid ABC transporter substrate-binding protein [Clostridiales bacterium]|nr:amino acid ABC transporter substrate-binding protein [Clostridiales bacterium]